MKGCPPPASGRGVLVCGACGAALSLPVCRLTDMRLVDMGHWGVVRVPQRTWAPAVDAPGRPAGERIWIHPHDLLVSGVEARGFGCCGYVPVQAEYNLFCRCGAAVGIFVDECACAIEVALDAVWEDAAAAPPLPGGVEERLARLGLERLSAMPERCSETTYWDVDLEPPRRGAKEAEIRLLERPGGPLVQLVTDGEERSLPMSAPELARAIGLLTLPIGPAALTVTHQLLGADNRVLETWALVQRGQDVEVLRLREGRCEAVVVWGEWLGFAWERAVEAWMASVE